jgi:hypothetical protein
MIAKGFSRSKVMVDMKGKKRMVKPKERKFWKREVVIACGYSHGPSATEMVDLPDFRVCRNHFDLGCFWSSIHIDENDQHTDVGLLNRSQQDQLRLTGNLRFGAKPMSTEELRFKSPTRKSPHDRAKSRSVTAILSPEQGTPLKTAAKILQNAMTVNRNLSAELLETHNKVTLLSKAKSKHSDSPPPTLDAPTSCPAQLSVESCETCPHKQTDKACKSLTGIPSWKCFRLLHDMIILTARGGVIQYRSGVEGGSGAAQGRPSGLS